MGSFTVTGLSHSTYTHRQYTKPDRDTGVARDTQRFHRDTLDFRPLVMVSLSVNGLSHSENARGQYTKHDLRTGVRDTQRFDRSRIDRGSSGSSSGSTRF